MTQYETDPAYPDPAEDSPAAEVSMRLARYGRREGGSDAAQRRERVRLLRILLPAAALVLLSAVALWPYLDRQGRLTADLPAEMTLEGTPSVDLGAGTVEMEDTRFTGRDRQGRPYEVLAERAIQSVRRDGLLDLYAPRARLDQAADRRITLSAETGRYDEANARLVLAGSVTIADADGNRLTTSEAQADLAAGTAWTDRPVEGSGPFGSILAVGAYVAPGGSAVVFDGPVRLQLRARRGDDRS